MKKLFCPHCSKDLKCDMGYPHDCTNCGWKQPNGESFSVMVSREILLGQNAFHVKVYNKEGKLLTNEAILDWYAKESDAMNVATIWADFLGCEVTVS